MVSFRVLCVASPLDQSWDTLEHRWTSTGYLGILVGNGWGNGIKGKEEIY